MRAVFALPFIGFALACQGSGTGTTATATEGTDGTADGPTDSADNSADNSADGPTDDSADGPTDASADGPTDGTTEDPTDECVPDDCSSLGFECGEHIDQCGGSINCGQCDLGECIAGSCVFEPSTQFEDEATTWSVPTGGQYLAGFDDLAGGPGESSPAVVGAHSWSTLDIDGDGLLDLVVTGEAVPRPGYNWWLQVLGYDAGAPHWDVYLNNGGGFDDTPTTWSVPTGGQYLAGFDALGGGPGESSPAVVGAHSWTTTDIDGDGLPDLVVTGEAVPRPGYNWWLQVLGYDAGAPYWDVYLNTGSGFADSPTAWSVPTGGQYLAGFDELAGGPGESSPAVVGAHSWSTTDIDGDGLPDLVVTGEAVPRPGYNWWLQVLGYDAGSPYWDVYLNDGSGFAGSPTTWSVPTGGQYLAGFDALGGGPGESSPAVVGAHSWTTTDLDGDGLLDLIITGEAVPRPGYNWWLQVLGYDAGAPRWDVHLNTGSGFDDSPTAWTVPTGGQYLAGFDELAGDPGESSPAVVGSHSWATTDLDGDRLPDLVVTGEAVPRPGYNWWLQVLGFDTPDPHWQIYSNTGSGFAETGATFSVPMGGQYLAGFDALGGGPGESSPAVVGAHAWTSTDLDGDGRLDLVVTGEAVPRPGYNWWLQVLGFESPEPHWNVFRGTY